jgi:hypothetical protein
MAAYMKHGRAKDREAFEAFLAQLSPEAEMAGLLGHGFPHSFYRVFVRNPGGQWWRIQEGYCGVKVEDPLKKVARLPATARTGAVFGPLRYLQIFQHIECEYMDMLVRRVDELLGPSDLEVVSRPKGGA